MRSSAGSSIRLAAAPLCAAAAFLVTVTSAHAGGPEPDNLFFGGGNAPTITGQTFAATGNMSTAGEEFMENDHAGYAPFQGSLWWKWVAPSSQRVRVQTCNLVQFNSIVAVYQDQGETAFPLTTPVASNDDGCATQSRLAFTPIQGETYFIAITKRDTTNTLTYEWSIRPTPANDLLADAEVLSATPPISAAGNSQGATEEPNENAHAGNTDVSGGASIWYSWTPTANLEVTFDTCGSQVTDTRLGIYEDGVAFPLTEVASAEGGCGTGFGGLAVFNAVANETYLIAVDGGENFPNEEAQEGAMDLDINARPANDDFADAQAISGALPLLNTAGSTAGATSEPPDEPLHAGSGAYRSVWYTWQPQVEGDVAIDTCESSVDTRLAAYTGALLDGLTEIDSNNNACGSGGNRSRVTFHALTTQTYRIAVDVSDVAGGTIDLDIAEADLTDPVATIDSSTINKPKGKAKFTFSGTDNVTSPAALSFTCRIDNKAEKPCTSPKVYRKQRKGKHTFRVFATDEAGNQSPTVKKTFRSSRG